MLFSSHAFLLLFLPVVLTGYFLLGRLQSAIWSRLFLLAASFIFYGWFNYSYGVMLLLSILWNYSWGWLLLEVPAEKKILRRLTAGFAVTGNLLLLGYFKYADFFLAACRSEIFGFGKSMSIPIDA